MPRYYLGVDVGQKGGLGIIDTYESKIEVFLFKRETFCEVLRSIEVTIMDNLSFRNAIACVESVHAMPGQGVSSMFSFGKSAGYIEGVLEALQIPYQLVHPKKWKKEFTLGSDKQECIEVCKKLFPTVSLLPTPRCTKESDGMAESLLMAEYAKRMFK